MKSAWSVPTGSSPIMAVSTAAASSCWRWPSAACWRALSGLLAGLAGAHLAMGIHRTLILNISLGLAFEGVVVALLARNNPLVVPFTGLLYSYLRAGAQFMERDAGVSFEVVRIIQAVIILLITAEALVTFFQNRRVQRGGAAEEPTPAPTVKKEQPANA